MTKAELDSKHIAELHSLAAEAGVPRYRMLPREELIEKLLDGKPAQAEREPRGEGAPKRERPPRRRRERSSADRPPRDRPPRDRAPREREAKEDAPTPPAAPEPAPEPVPVPPAAAEAERPRRKRRRRRFGRKSKGLGVTDLLLPPPARQALVYGESRTACTALLREIAGELSGESSGPDPIALLVDPSPEELADWKREAPQAELVAAAQARHAGDALAQAVRRAESGEDVILLIDSLTRLEDADTAREIFDAGLKTPANGSLTVVAALERQA
ncbi:MAG TPA: Rho termination factor N-terminal domain-containing protein [Solirubrobacterales bacterium]|nr:Rho termination factor N-terminal domain-containing protein [Solirubrobacterales bacterium]